MIGKIILFIIIIPFIMFISFALLCISAWLLLDNGHDEIGALFLFYITPIILCFIFIKSIHLLFFRKKEDKIILNK